MAEHLLTADVESPTDEIEAEPVTITTSETAIEFLLLDGVTVTFSREQLLEVLGVDVNQTERAA